MASGWWRVLSVALAVGISTAYAVADKLEPNSRAAAVSRCTKVEPPAGTPSVPSGYIFGLTDPTDPGDPCTWELGFEAHARVGKRDGRYLGVATKTEIGYTYSQNVAFSLAAFHTYTRWSDVTASQDALASAGDGVLASNVSKLGFDGLSGELFVRVLSRSPGQPLAVSVAVEPRWGRIDSLTGHLATSYGAEFKLLMDAPITNRLFAGVNIIYGLGQQKLDIPNAEWSRGSFVSASAALSAEVYAAEKKFIERVMVGVEGVGATPFNGLLLDKIDGYAFFFGPTLGIGFSGDRFLSFVWLPQIAGQARFPSLPGAKDLDHFERHEFRVKLAAPLKF